jgi:hypothetical protein
VAGTGFELVEAPPSPRRSPDPYPTPILPYDMCRRLAAGSPCRRPAGAAPPARGRSAFRSGRASRRRPARCRRRAAAGRVGHSSAAWSDRSCASRTRASTRYSGSPGGRAAGRRRRARGDPLGLAMASRAPAAFPGACRIHARVTRPAAQRRGKEKPPAQRDAAGDVARGGQLQVRWACRRHQHRTCGGRASHSGLGALAGAPLPRRYHLCPPVSLAGRAGLHPRTAPPGDDLAAGSP